MVNLDLELKEVYSLAISGNIDTKRLETILSKFEKPDFIKFILDMVKENDIDIPEEEPMEEEVDF